MTFSPSLACPRHVCLGLTSIKLAVLDGAISHNSLFFTGPLFYYYFFSLIQRYLCLPSLGLGTVLLSVVLGTYAALCHLTTAGPCLPRRTPNISLKGHSFYIGTASTAAAAGLPDCFINVFEIVGCLSVTKCIFILLKLSRSLLFPKWLVCQGTLFRLCLGCLGGCISCICGG